jgi:tetratricopeptide (TPR) repeat protein
VKNHIALLESYEQRLKNLDPELITIDEEIFLTEAFIHAKEVFEPEKLVKWFTIRAEPFYRPGSWKVVLPMYEELLDIAEKKLGSENPGTATVLNGMARIYRYIGNYEEALKHLSRALKIHEMLPGTELADIGDILSEMGILNYLMDKQALSYYTQALEIQKKFFSSENLGAVITLNRMAFFYRGMKKPEKAEEFFNRALEFLEIFQEQKPDKRVITIYKAGTLNNLGILLSEMGKIEEAEDRYGKALKLQDKVYGPEHPQVAQTLNNLALLYFQTSRYEKALILNTRSLEIMEKLGKTEHPGFATTLNNLAGIYVHKGRHEKALELYKRALEIRERILSPDHPDVAKTLNNLGELYRIRGHHKKALHMYTRALNIYKTTFGITHPDIGTTLNNLAGLHESLGEYNTAIDLYEKALDIIRKEYGSDHPYFKITRNNLISLYDKMNGACEAGLQKSQ